MKSFFKLILLLVEKVYKLDGLFRADVFTLGVRYLQEAKVESIYRMQK